MLLGRVSLRVPNPLRVANPHPMSLSTNTKVSCLLARYYISTGKQYLSSSMGAAW